jgi:hypothetical protein
MVFGVQIRANPPSEELLPLTDFRELPPPRNADLELSVVPVRPGLILCR